MNFKSVLLAATAVSILATGSGVQAGAGAAEADGQEVENRDIIITARRRQESVLNVPVVASVLDQEVLNRAQITDLRGITGKVPGLIVGTSVLSVGTQISLRGIGTSALDAGIDQSVSLNIDGQQFSQGLTFKSGLFDLAQAEVLKGPQALFFGKNSPGGVIALSTADPGADFEVIARGSYEFESMEQRVEMIVSGPMSDTFGIRLAGAWSDSEGYFKNTATATPGLGGLNPDRRWGGNQGYILRGTALWTPSDAFRMRLKVNVTQDKSHGPASLQNVSCPSGTGPSVAGFQFIGGPIRCTQDRNVELVDMDPAAFSGVNEDGTPGLRNGGKPFTHINQKFGALQLDYDVTDAISLNSTTTYYANTMDGSINGVSAGEAGPVLFADNHFTRRDVTQEFRLDSDYMDSPINWMLGGFYQSGRVKNRIYIGGNQALGVGLPPALSAGSHNIGIETFALFGQTRWNPVEKLEIAGGVRWTSEARDLRSRTRNGATGQFLNVDLVTPKISSKNWSPELTITYTPTDDFTLFGALKQGYKSGSFSITTPVALPTATTPVKDNSFGDEKVQGGEFGLKSRWLDRALTANLAFYYYKYQGLQVGVSQPSDGAPILRTLNAGSARTYGIDFDATYNAPIDGLSANVAVNWNRAKFLELDGVPCYGGQTIALGCNQSLNPITDRYTAASATGQTLEKAPTWQITGGIDYEMAAASTLDIAFGASAQYSSDYRVVIGNRDDYWQQAYAKINAYFTLRDPQKGWELSLIGNNLFDVLRGGYCANSDFRNSTVFSGSAAVTGGLENPSGKIDEVGCVLDPGRSVFVRLTLRPGELFR